MRNRTVKHLLLFTTIAMTFVVTSCVDQKAITYFQPLSEKTDVEKTDAVLKAALHLKPGDIISVGVSSISPESNTMFNPFLVMQQMSNQNVQPNTLAPAVGYMINDEGAISLPMVGKVEVAGLNTKEAATLIVQKLDKYLINPIVNVRMLNYTISVLGEVAHPSVFNVPNERVTLPEAISLAGDLTIYAMRNNVLVIREKDGKREFARVDLTKRDLFNSPYYYLQPNDVVYVEPGKNKAASTNRTLIYAPTIISALSLITILFTYVKIK